MKTTVIVTREQGVVVEVEHDEGASLTDIIQMGVDAADFDGVDTYDYNATMAEGWGD